MKNLAIFALTIIIACLLFLLFDMWIDKRNLESTVIEQQRVINTYKKIEETGKTEGEEMEENRKNEPSKKESSLKTKNTTITIKKRGIALKTKKLYITSSKTLLSL